jgi:hypothetical protein
VHETVTKILPAEFSRHALEDAVEIVRHCLCCLPDFVQLAVGERNGAVMLSRSAVERVAALAALPVAQAWAAERARRWAPERIRPAGGSSCCGA